LAPSTEDAEDEAFGPIVHGCSVFLLPGITGAEQLRRTYLECLRTAGLPHGDLPSAFEDPTDIYQGPVPTFFLTIRGRSVIYCPIGDETIAPLLSSLLHTPVLLVQPLGKAVLWTYVLYGDGHMVSRYASCPEWIPAGYLGDPDFDEYERVHGRANALREYMDTWAGDPELIGRLFDAPISKIAPYMRQFTLAELGEWGSLRKRYAEHKVRPEDRYSIASPWVLVHFVEQLGIEGFRDIYFDIERRRACRSAPEVYSPAQYRMSHTSNERPPCSRDPFPYGGFFRSHEAICGNK
jgi:hypothetical protein